MTVEERAHVYKGLFKACKALEPVAQAYAKGYADATPIERLEIIRELDTVLAERYNVFIPVITCWVRDDSYVASTKEIFLGEPTLEGFLHQFRHHLQNEAREQSRRHLLVEEDKSLDYKLPFKYTEYTMYGEDDARAWTRFLLETALGG